jgi:N-acetyl sugar amidotransferase
MDIKVCSRCVMDNVSDDTITFEADGTCNYCNYSLNRMNDVYFPNDIGKEKIHAMVELLKEKGKDKEYDCLMGLSGGLDSAYLAYLGAKHWGLRILAVHADDGFDTVIAKQNIENLCGMFDIKLIIDKPDVTEYTDLLKAFIRSGVPSIALPQDNVLQACLKINALKYKLKFYLSGANFSLESTLQRGNGHIAADSAHIRDIHRKHGEFPLSTLPLINIFDRYLCQKYINRIKTLRPLDYIEYNRERAIEELAVNAGFNYYGGKHYESIFTKFVQVYYLPNKFGIDKRKSHFSSLIVSGQMNREEALLALAEPLYDEEQMERDINLILSKLAMDRSEFDTIMKEPGKSHDEYKTSFFIKYASIARRFRMVLGE